MRAEGGGVRTVGGSGVGCFDYSYVRADAKVASLFWCFVMLGFILYMFSLIFLQAFAGMFADEALDLDEGVREEIFEKFGSVRVAMLTMFKLTTGEGWSEVYAVVSLTGFIYKAIFIFFVGFIQFAVTNILTALFLENAIKNAQPDHNSMIFEQRRQDLLSGL